MIDVKKLITGFLILATAAGASGIILSFVSGFSASAQAPAGAQTGVAIGGVAANATSSPIAANAFVDTGTLQGNAAEVVADTDTSSTQTAAADPDNITNTFADSFLNGLVAANPNGVAANVSGSPEFNPPDTQAMAAAIASAPAVQDFKVPNWDVEVDEQPIKTTKDTSPTAIAQYSDSLNAIFNKYFVSTELQNLINGQTSDPSTLSYVNTQVQGALNDTLALQVPSSLVGFQKSLVRVLVYEKNSAALGQVADTDPVKASLIMQDEQIQYAAAITGLQNQMQSANSVGLLFGEEPASSSVPLIAQLFGVQPAHAIFGIGDITFDPATFGELVLKYANDAILQILKNTLVALIQRKVLTWIQGSGAPRFVTDFASQLVNSFQAAAINKLNSEISCVPIYQQQVLKVMLSTPSLSTNGNNSCAAEFQGQLGNNLANLSNLYGHFTNFNDYFAVMGPTGNTWSNLITIHDSALAAGNVSQSAKTTQNIAQQGFTGSQVCADGSDPNNGAHMECDGVPTTDEELNCSNGSVPDAGICDNGDQATCDDTSIPELIPNAGLCADGNDPKITSPGQVTAQSMSSALGSSISNITSASNIAGILNALLSSLLNTLAQSAINYAGQTVNGVLTDSGVSGVAPTTINTGSPVSTPATAVQCLPSIQDAIISTSTSEAVVSLSAGGGALNTTCAANNNCPSTINPDGSPIYIWSAPGSVEASTALVNGTSLTGSTLTLTYPTAGQYFAVVTASTDNTTSSCEIDVQ